MNIFFIARNNQEAVGFANYEAFIFYIGIWESCKSECKRLDEKYFVILHINIFIRSSQNGIVKIAFKFSWFFNLIIISGHSVWFWKFILHPYYRKARRLRLIFRGERIGPQFQKFYLIKYHGNALRIVKPQTIFFSHTKYDRRTFDFMGQNVLFFVLDDDYFWCRNIRMCHAITAIPLELFHSHSLVEHPL